MAPPRKERGLAMHRRSCPRKIRHASEYRALKAMHALERHQNFDGKAMKVYECTACGGWHVGHVARPRKKKGSTEK